jgi:uncharacterized membrane protein
MFLKVPTGCGRSFLKALTWRALGSVDTFVLAFLATGKPTAAISVAGFEVFTKTALYFVHERVWAKVPSTDTTKAFATIH